MNQIFEELKARILSDLKGHFPPDKFCFAPGEFEQVMACAAASAEDRPLESEGFIPHPMTGDERSAIVRNCRWGAQAIELGHTLANKGDLGKLTPRQLRAAHVLAWAGMVSMGEADVVFLETKNAHTFSEETEAAIIEKREELKNSFDNLKNAFNEYRSYLPSDEGARFAKLFALEDASLFAPEDAPETRPIGRQRAQEIAILEELRRLGYDPEALPRWNAKAGPKAQARRELLKSRPDIFQSEGIFDKGWGRLRAAREVKESG